MERFSTLPVGFAMALVQNEAAMDNFNHLSREQRESVLRQAHSVGSKAEMRRLVDTLASPF